MTTPILWRMMSPQSTYRNNGTFTKDVNHNTNDPHFRLENLIYLIVALVCIIISYACFAVRITSIRETHSFFKLTFNHFLALLTYSLGCSFCVSTCLLYFGDTIYNYSACHGAIITSLVFYLGQKLCLYLFLIERAYSVKVDIRPRWKDVVYLTGLVFLLVGFSGIGVAVFKYHRNEYDWDSGSCQIGLGVPMAAVIMAWDVLVIIFLTIVFVQRCEPYMVRGLRAAFLYPVLRGVKKMFSCRRKKATRQSGPQPVVISQDVLVHVIRKAFWGCLGILALTVVNFSILISWDGKEEVWYFFTFFTVEATWGLIILHCLTSAPHELTLKPQISSVYSGLQPYRFPYEHGLDRGQSTAVPPYANDNIPRMGDDPTRSPTDLTP